VRRTTQIHRDRGFPNAQVSIITGGGNHPHNTDLTVVVNPGQPLRIARRVIVIPDQASAVLRSTAEKYAVVKGDRADSEAIQAADNALENELRVRNYHSARVSHKIQMQGGLAVLYVRVETGPQLRYRFEGNLRFDSDQLSDVIATDGNSDPAPADLGNMIEVHYRRFGMLDTTVRVERRGAPADAVNEIVFFIREGGFVEVVGKEFPCLRGGPYTLRSLIAEIDAVLSEELPGGDLLGSVDPKVVSQIHGPTGVTGARPSPIDPNPTAIYDPVAYEKAIKHIRELYRSHGYLSATVGPIQVKRRACHRHSPAGQCIPVPFPSESAATCTFNPRGLPVDDPPPDPRLQCKPNRSLGVECEPRVWVYVPIKLGPQTTLYDAAFEGNRAITESALMQAADLELGKPASNLGLEQARRRIIDTYKELGYAYAEVRATLDLSPDRTRARARFVINESLQVIVDRIVVVGAQRTSESLILGRVSLRVGQPYRSSDIRKSEERIATLGTFASVSISLQDPYVPARRKTVLIHVQERLPQYLEVRPGFSTGEGVRAQFEYGHLNIAGQAIRFTLRLRVSYLPDILILDDAVRANLNTLRLSQRLERHNTASILFPEIGLGPLISLNFDGIDVRSNARDFGLSKNAFAATLNFRPFRTLSLGLGGSLERNDVAIFEDQSVLEYLQRPGVTSDLRRLLLAPDGLTYAVAQLATISWDKRDNSLDAKRGTLIGGAVEHVRAFPGSDNPNSLLSDSLRVSTTISAYYPLTRKGLSVAGSIRAGRVFQLKSGSETYPDRLFFLGGADSIRGHLRDSVVPQDIAQRILDSSPNDPNQLTINQVAIRGGNVYINPRFELRIPLSTIVQTTLFLDTGNLWVEPSAINPANLRYAAGSGLRIATPIGPLAFDYGINIDRRPWEDFGAFHFSIGLF
ncbi:MAG: BamA/TamA family outer membrane protein, partial [Polyangiaceae bacterium]|nr:BamA/TamA family outer membrane protein [Polyangiaceae bacterium]